MGKPCPVCNQVSNQILTKTLRRGKGTVFYCTPCDLGFLDSEQFDVKAFYESKYRESVSHNADQASTNAAEIFGIYKKYQDQRLALIEPHLSEEKAVLEVGASAGQFLCHILDKCKSVSAVELDLDCVEFLKENFDIELSQDYLEASQFADIQYDIVCAFQVLEHTVDPVEFLKTIYNATKPGGRAYVELPNLYDPLLSLWKIPKYKTFFYHSEHLFYFSGKALADVAVRAGFAPEKIEVHYTQDYSILNHLHWAMNDAPQPTCDVGLSPVGLGGDSNEITDWVTRELTTLNDAYIAKLIAKKSTSNLMIEMVK